MKAYLLKQFKEEQDVVIRDMENDLLMVQGVAGSGKPLLFHRRLSYVSRFINKLSANNIMIISLISEQYISNVLPELGEDNVISSVCLKIYLVINWHENSVKK